MSLLSRPPLYKFLKKQCESSGDKYKYQFRRPHNFAKSSGKIPDFGDVSQHTMTSLSPIVRGQFILVVINCCDMNNLRHEVSIWGKFGRLAQ